MSAPGARLAAEQTHRVLAAQMTLAELVTTRQLHITEAACTPGARQLLPDGGYRFLGAPTITLLVPAAAFPAWAALLGVDQVLLHRQPFDITAHTGAVDHLHHLWRVSALVVRSKSLRPTDDLPGDTAVPWRQERARIGVARLAAALTARRLT